MNEYDSDRIIENLKRIDYTQTAIPAEADCYILNTCHIREKATDKVYHDIGRVKKIFRNKKKPIVVVAGCVAQAEGEILLKKEKYIDCVIGPQSYHYLNNILLQVEKKNERVNFTEFEAENKFDNLEKIENSPGKVSSYLTIQEGCDKFCKFCVVPYTRGPEFSRKFEQIISEANQLVRNRTKEIILLGQNVNAYNYSNKNLSDLILKLEEINGLERLRFTTSHPKDMNENLIKLFKVSKKLMPHLHLPVQSGSNVVLKNMNRKHTVEEYLKIIYQLKEINPKIEFSSDFIIAYPGETEEDFNLTLKLLNDVKYINTYSYIFSPRYGTPAAKLNLIDEKIAKKRLTEFQNISEKIKKEYKRRSLNKTLKVLFENKIKENYFFGRDEYQNSIIVNSKDDITRKIMYVKIIDFNLNTMTGHLVSQKNLAA